MSPQIPTDVGRALGGLATRRGVSAELEGRLASIARNLFRAYTASEPDREIIAAVLARIGRYVALMGPEPTAAEAEVARDLRSLAGILETQLTGPPPPAAPRSAAAVAPATPAPVQPVVDRAPPIFIARERQSSGAPRPNAASPPRSPVVPPPLRPRLVAQAFPEALAGRVARDWYWFVLEELNGLGTLLNYQRGNHDADAAARTEQRVQATVDTLAWDAVAACRDAWTFVGERLHDADDVWGPHLVLDALEPERARVRDWASGLPPGMRAVIESVPPPLQGA
jgi:hypothetical protein